MVTPPPRNQGRGTQVSVATSQTWGRRAGGEGANPRAPSCLGADGRPGHDGRFPRPPAACDGPAPGRSLSPHGTPAPRWRPLPPGAEGAEGAEAWPRGGWGPTHQDGSIHGRRGQQPSPAGRPGQARDGRVPRVSEHLGTTRRGSAEGTRGTRGQERPRLRLAAPPVSVREVEVAEGRTNQSVRGAQSPPRGPRAGASAQGERPASPADDTGQGHPGHQATWSRGESLPPDPAAWPAPASPRQAPSAASWAANLPPRLRSQSPAPAGFSACPKDAARGSALCLQSRRSEL